MKIVCPTCGSAMNRPVAGGSIRECSMCYTRYELPKQKARKSKLAEPEAEETTEPAATEPNEN